MGLSAGSAALISAGIEAAAAGGTAAFNGIGASKRQKRAQRYYERNVQNQRDYNERYTRMMLHDTPAIEYQGMVDAGINPMLSEGSNYSNVGISPSDSSIQAPEPTFQPLDFRSMAAPIQQAILNQAQVNNLDAQTGKIIKELPQVEAMTEYYKSQKNLTDAQAGSIAINNRKTQEEINNLILTQDLTRTRKREIEQRILDVVPKQLEALSSQISLNLKDLSVKDSQIYLNNERAKSEYSRRQLNFSNVHNIEQLAVKTMYDALTGQLTYEMASDTFASAVESAINENIKKSRENQREARNVVDASEDSTYFQICAWYNEVIGALLRPIGSVLGSIFHGK